MFDSVYVFAAGLTSFGRSHTLRPANLSCDLEQPWQDGLQLYNHISSVSMFNVISFSEFVVDRPERSRRKKNSINDPARQANHRAIQVNVSGTFFLVKGAWLRSKLLIVERGILLDLVRSMMQMTRKNALARRDNSIARILNVFCAPLKWESVIVSAQFPPNRK